jgi:hypothetical protein
MSQTRLQTATVIIAGVDNFYFTLEKRPIPNSEFEDRITVGNIVTTTSPKDGCLYKWFHNGDIERIETNGTKTTWWAVPTMDSVINRRPNDEFYCRFYPNGTITMAVSGSNFYWGPLIAGEPQTGSYWVTSCQCDDCYDDYLSDCSRHYYRSHCYCYDGRD